MNHQEHSEAYKSFFRYLNATGMEKAYGGYASDTLDRIYDWERDDVEKTIWQRFKKYGSFPDLVSQLQQYDGVEALKEKLREGMINSEWSWQMADIACALYKATSIEDYLDYVFEFYDKKKDFGTVAALSYLKPCDKLYDFFKTVYLNSDDSVARNTAVDGMLSCKGYIKDPHDHQKNSEFIGMKRAFMSDDRLLRRKKLMRFENGDFDNIPRTYGLYKTISYEESIRLAKEPKPKEAPGEMIKGIIDATESNVYIVYCESENTYNPAVPSEDLDVKPAIGDKVDLYKKQKGQSIIMRVLGN